MEVIDFHNRCDDGHLVFEDVFTAAAANPALKHLSLVDCYGGVETSEPYPPIRPPPSGLPALESLSISGADNISWLFFTQSLYSINGIRRLSLQMTPVTPPSLIQSLLNEMQETLECFTLDINPRMSKSMSLTIVSHSLAHSTRATDAVRPEPTQKPLLLLHNCARFVSGPSYKFGAGNAP